MLSVGRKNEPQSLVLPVFQPEAVHVRVWFIAQAVELAVALDRRLRPSWLRRREDNRRATLLVHRQSERPTEGLCQPSYVPGEDHDACCLAEYGSLLA